METTKNPDQLTRAGNSEIRNNTGKDTQYYWNQELKLKQAFSGTPKTMLMVAKRTGIERANICRYVSKLKKANQIHFVRFDLCEVSKVRAGYYSTH